MANEQIGPSGDVPDSEQTDNQRSDGIVHFLKADPSFMTKLVLLGCLLGLGVVGFWFANTVPAEQHQDTAQAWVITVTVLLIVGLIGLAFLGSFRRQAAHQKSTEAAARSSDGVARRLLSESLAMLDYSLSKGLDVDPAHLQTVYEAQVAVTKAEARAQQDDAGEPRLVMAAGLVGKLAAARRHLVEVVRPATPSTLELLQNGDPSVIFPPLGRVRLIRHMLYVAVVFLISAFGIIIAADPLSVADAPTQANGGIDGAVAPVLGDEWVDRLWNSLFLVVVAGLGAAFFALYTATGYVKQNSYDEQYEPTYWIRFVLGLVGGFTLALLVGEDFLGESSIGISLLAFIGGFSADVVQRVLQRVVDTVDALIRGSSDGRIEQQQRDQQSKAMLDVATDRLHLAAPLLALESRLSTGLSTDEARTLLRNIVEEMLPFGASSKLADPPHDPPADPVDDPPAEPADDPAVGDQNE